MGDTAVSARGLVKDFGNFRAVDGLSFEVGKGEFFGILGPNGAGKTTTVRMIYGYSPTTAGELEVFGLSVADQRRKVAALTGVCQQDNNLDPDLSVYENLLVFARYFDIPKAVAQKRAEELLAFIAMEGRRSSKIMELSGGLQRRLVLARALINNPSLLILDEPTTGLDPQSRHQLWDKLRELRAGGLTVLLTTHYMDEAERLCDRLIIMDNGKLLVEGAPQDLIRAHAGRQVVEINDPDESLRRFVRDGGIDADDLGNRMILYSNHAQEEFSSVAERFCSGSCVLRSATLEDVFLRLTGRGLRE